MAGQNLTPEPGSLVTASEPGIQAASVGNAEEKIKALKPPVEKTKNEEVSDCSYINKQIPRIMSLGCANLIGMSS